MDFLFLENDLSSLGMSSLLQLQRNDRKIAVRYISKGVVLGFVFMASEKVFALCRHFKT